ncbi:HAAS signaling domain-containing protein [Virgibacillus flavescens]|uniref:HAAS signaling domain-containing protein n=1 Tax=Virgibacillus flavescens TaxID=1611422 RepID=UPI003D333BBA
MNSKQFINELESALKGLPDAERQDILRDFQEHFTMGLAEGKTEEQIASSLGSPQHIAKELRATHHVEKMEATASTGNILRAVWAVIGLGFFNLVIVLGPLIALASIVFAGWVSGFAFVVSPVLVVIEALFFPSTFEWFELFFSIMLTGAGLLLLIGLFYATKALINLFIRYLKYNVSLVKGGLKDE